MRLNDTMRFAHPLLSPETGDYLSGEFTFDVTAVAEAFVKDQVTLDYTVILSEPTLRGAITNGRATVGIFVTCLDTYFSRAIPLGVDSARISFDPGSLVGRVEIRPLIWATEDILEFSLANCHEEFGGSTMAVRSGDILALGDLRVLSIGRDKLAQMDTIFSIVRAEHLPDNELSVSLDADRIQILIAANIHQQVNDLRAKKFGHPIVLNGVYLPAVMQVLDILREGIGEYESKRWYRVFAAKCEYRGIDMRAPDLWHDAQKLLDEPFAEIASAREYWGE